MLCLGRQVPRYIINNGNKDQKIANLELPNLLVMKEC